MGLHLFNQLEKKCHASCVNEFYSAFLSLFFFKFPNICIRKYPCEYLLKGRKNNLGLKDMLCMNSSLQEGEVGRQIELVKGCIP